jgi:glycosyltransferase domain-containing protein
MQDFTLVIPTYNRPKPLEALLAYLRAKKQRCRILILDSSLPQQREVNRSVIALTDLKIQYSEFPSEMHPFDKFREGVHQVTTEFCALCGDDDLVVLDGVERCLDTLRHNPQASVAQGYSFSFQCQPNGDMDLGSILYFTSTVDDATPLARLAKLFSRYQAATYGNYRTPALQRILAAIRPMTSILGRELLGSALAAIQGQMIRVPCFSHGRSTDASESYEHWHPLEWFAKDPQGLFSEYCVYRELMEQAVLEQPDNNLDAAAVRRILDLISLRYLIKHAPDGALAFMTQQKLFGAAFGDYWPRPEIHQPLYEAACIGTTAPAETEVTSVRRTRFGRARAYHLHPNFSAPRGVDSPRPEAIKTLLLGLDDYRFLPPAAVPVRTQLPAHTRLPLRRTISVSVLLCNYNDARYLPDSLTAICTQTRLPEEVIVLDDGSTDDSMQIIRDFGRRYPFIRILRNETNRGLLYSINRALNAARCDFIVWAAADDRLLPNFIERNAMCLRQHPNAGLSISRLAVFKDGSNDITPFTEKTHGIAFDFGTEPHFLSPQMLRERLQKSHLWISANTAMASRTALLKAGGFDQELRWHADYFGFLAVALRHGVCCIPETLATMRQREQTYSSTGMGNRLEQRATLGRLADKLTSKGWRDIGVAVLRCPALLSPFGGEMLEALLRKPRRWPFALTYGLWWANHQWGRRGGTVALVARRCTRMILQAVLIALEGAGRFVRWARHR